MAMHLMMHHLSMIPLGMFHLLMIHTVGWHTHHLQHCGTSCAQEADDQYSSNDQEKDIEHRRIVPLHSFRDGDHVPVLWDDPKRRKEELDNIARSGHRHIEGDQNIAHDLPAIIFAVDVQKRQNDQISKNEADHATEAYAPFP